MAERTCTVEGCDRCPRSRDLCALHYGQWYRSNPPDIKRRQSPREHILSDICPETKTATCAACGPGIALMLKRNSNGSVGWRCRVSQNRWKGSPKPSSQRARRYGLQKEDYLAMRRRQNDRCAICQRQAPLLVDHCHKTSRVRGLLCQSCNFALGLFQDNPNILRVAIRYLKSAPTSHEAKMGALFEAH